MSDEITVGHYASHASDLIATMKSVYSPLDKRRASADSLSQIVVKLTDAFEDLHSEKQTLQQVVFARDRTIRELRDELKSAQGDGAWISVKDRLPEPLKVVLIFNLSGVWSGCYSTSHKEWWDVDCELLEPVTHWRELPTPPKEKG